MSGAGANEDVRLTPEIPCGDAVADSGVFWVCQADPILRKECLLEVPSVEIGDVAEHQIGLAGLQHSWGIAADLRRLDADARRNAANVGEDGGKKRDVACIRHADDEAALCSRRIKLRAKLRQTPQHLQRPAWPCR